MLKIVSPTNGDPRFALLVRRRRFGVVEVRDGAFQGIRFRPWPKLVSRWGVWWGERTRGWRSGDRCRLYYNQLWGSSNYLSLNYVEGGRETSYDSIRCALAVFDEIARLKRVDALVCEVANAKISDRFVRREGWAPHLAESGSRHFIKRFYGEYPPSRLPELTAAWENAVAETWQPA